MARRLIIWAVLGATTFGFASFGGVDPASAAVTCLQGETLHLTLVVKGGTVSPFHVSITVANCTAKKVAYIQRSKYVAPASCGGGVTHLADIHDSVPPFKSRVTDSGPLTVNCSGNWVFKTRLVRPTNGTVITHAEATFACCPV